MGASALMSIGIKSMAASYAQMQTTSHNIANAHVEGYSRQKTELATSKGQFTGAGFFGKGVDVQTVSRIHNAFLTREAVAARSVANLDAAQLGMLEKLELLFKPGEQGLGHSVGQFLNSMVDLASRPADSSTREVVLARGEEMSNRFAHLDMQLEALQRNVTSDINTQVAEFNALTKNIAEANGKIAALSGLGQPANDLMDERDRLVARLNDILQVSTVPADDGSVSVFIGGGYRVVLATLTEDLHVLQDPEDPSRAAVGFQDGRIDRPLPTDTLGGGSIVGLMRFQNDHLVDARNQLGQLAASVAGAANTQQLLGMNLYTPFGSVPVEPFFKLGETRAVAHGANARGPDGQLVGDLAITRTAGESSKLVAFQYSLRVEADGSWMIARLPDPKDSDWQPLAPGQSIDGFSIDVVPGFDPVPGDRFLIQPVARAARGMSMLLDDVRDIAAASPLVATAFPTPTGTVSIESLRMLQAPTNPTQSIRINFTDDQGHYTWTWFDENGDLGPPNVAATPWTPGQPIPPDPAEMNGFALMLRGVPRTGDVLKIEPASAGNFAQNNGNALALAMLRDEHITAGLTATDAYAAAMADVGVRVQGARSTSTISTAMADQAEQARSNESGVNMDEEAARLIQFQQSYQAAAKVLQIAQSVFETLLSTAGTG